MGRFQRRHELEGYETSPRAFGRRSRAVAFAALLLLAPSRGRAQAWRPIGIEGFPQASALAIDHSHDAGIFAAFGGAGVFRSLDGGDSWSTARGDLGARWVTQIVTDPEAPQRIYAVGYRQHDPQVFWSVDSGGTWTASEPLGMRSLAIDPAAPGVLFATNVEGIFRTTDGAESWTKVYHLRGMPSFEDALDWEELPTIAIDPAGTIYAISAFRVPPFSAVLRSVDGGTSWERLGEGVFPHPDDNYQESFHLAVGGGSVYAFVRSELFRSDDAGETWLPLDLPVNEIESLVVDSVNPDVVYVASRGPIFRSSDRGEGWEALARPGSRMEQLAIDPRQVGTLYLACQQGVFRSTNGGHEWSRRGRASPDGSDMSIVRHAPTRPSTLYAIGLSGFRATMDGGRTWREETAGIDADLTSIAVHPVDPDLVYVGRWGNFRKHGGVSVSRDGGVTFQLSSEGLPSVDGRYAPVYDLAIDPHDADSIFAATASNRVYASYDGGGRWVPFGRGLMPGFAVRSFAFSPGELPTLYAGLAAPLYTQPPTIARLDREERRWEVLPIDHANGRTVFDLAFDPRDARVLYAATDDGVWKSEDEGESWTDASSDLPREPGDSLAVHALVQDASRGESLYAATRSGVYRSSDGGGSWRAAREGLLPASLEAPITDLARTSLGASMLTATSDGVYELDLGCEGAVLEDARLYVRDRGNGRARIRVRGRVQTSQTAIGSGGGFRVVVETAVGEPWLDLAFPGELAWTLGSNVARFPAERSLEPALRSARFLTGDGTVLVSATATDEPYRAVTATDFPLRVRISFQAAASEWRFCTELSVQQSSCDVTEDRVWCA